MREAATGTHMSSSVRAVSYIFIFYLQRIVRDSRKCLLIGGIYTVGCIVSGVSGVSVVSGDCKGGAAPAQRAHVPRSSPEILIGYPSFFFLLRQR